jgi:hypothetical protein
LQLHRAAWSATPFARSILLQTVKAIGFFSRSGSPFDAHVRNAQQYAAIADFKPLFWTQCACFFECNCL